MLFFSRLRRPRRTGLANWTAFYHAFAACAPMQYGCRCGADYDACYAAAPARFPEFWGRAERLAASALARVSDLRLDDLERRRVRRPAPFLRLPRAQLPPQARAHEDARAWATAAGADFVAAVFRLDRWYSDQLDEHCAFGSPQSETCQRYVFLSVSFFFIVR